MQVLTQLRHQITALSSGGLGISGKLSSKRSQLLALLGRQLRGRGTALLRQEDAETRALTLQILKTGICFQAEAALQLTQPAIQLRIQRSWTQIWGCTVGLLSCDHSCCACRTASRCCQC